MTIANVSSILSPSVSNAASSVASAANTLHTTTSTSASLNTAFANVFQKGGGFAADWDDNWCGTRPPGPPHIGGPGISIPSEIR